MSAPEAVRHGVVIVGAGQAGAWVAKSLRASGYGGRIVLLGDERWMPYERPSLSKSLLSGLAQEPIFALTEAEAQAAAIDVRLGTSVSRIARDEHAVICADGERIAYDQLVLATGGHARVPSVPGIDLPGVHTLRTVDDCRSLAARLQPGRRALIVGGGWIGLEVAATLRKADLSVTVVEAGERLCARSVPPVVSDFLLQLHRQAGVAVHLGGSLESIEQAPDGSLTARISGQPVEADVVVVGIGLVPNTGLASDCGLEVANGVVVDAQGRSSDADIFAVGDVANQLSSWTGGRTRFECWFNAQNQAVSVGKALAGETVHHDDLPWFWSDQYDCNIQVLGVPVMGPAELVVRGSIEEHRFTMFQFVEGTLRAVVAVNSGRDIKVARRWMNEGRVLDPLSLTDASVRLDRL